MEDNTLQIRDGTEKEFKFYEHLHKSIIIHDQGESITSFNYAQTASSDFHVILVIERHLQIF